MRNVFADLLAHPGVEERCELAGRVGFCALHGGLEQSTAEIATAAAAAAGASLYAVVQPDDLRWHISSKEFLVEFSPALRTFVEHVDVVISLHGYGGLRDSDDRWTTVLVGGANRALAAELASELRAALPEYTWLDDIGRIPAHLRGVHPDNPVNGPCSGGVQLELPPRVRGFGHYWRDFAGPGLPPHTVTLIDTLAAFATAKAISLGDARRR
jgi:phage replication-related protein YjqB (UPF0714/DUF867 family)